MQVPKEEKKNDSHNDFFKNIMNFLIFEGLINGPEMKDLMHLNTLKEYRVRADYRKGFISKEDVKLARGSYEICSNVIDKIIDDAD